MVHGLHLHKVVIKKKPKCASVLFVFKKGQIRPQVCSQMQENTSGQVHKSLGNTGYLWGRKLGGQGKDSFHCMTFSAFQVLSHVTGSPLP